jgi:hypothetical protein
MEWAMRAFLEVVAVIIAGSIIGLIAWAASVAVLYGSIRLLWVVNVGVTHYPT